jgi:putative ATPase
MDLFDHRRERDIAAEAPLAARMRPRTLDEYVGQDAIIGPGRLLRRAIQADQLGSLLFYGPPGTGKTTLAQVIANSTEAEFIAMNAVLSGVKDIRAAIARARAIRGERGKRTILFIDEVHRFNKAQQDALLPWVENGTVILVGATTENPYFEVNKALVSRSRVFRLEPLTELDLRAVVQMALSDPKRGYGDRPVELAPEAVDHLVDVSNGDARALLNALELAVETTTPDEDGVMRVPLAVAEESIQRRAVLYDKEGDAHYDAISAFIKSCRGSDPDAALYWLARMVHAGEDPRYLFRRLIILASEDVGLADPDCVGRVMQCAEAFDRIGMPEGRYPLAQATLAVATAPKSNSIMGFFEALAAVQRERTGDVPDHLKDPSRDKKGFGHGEGYLYPHAYRDHWVNQQYLPAGLVGQVFYQPSDQGFEAGISAQVITRREAQLAALEAGAAEPLGLTAGPADPGVDRWVRRASAGAGAEMTRLRARLFEAAELQRHYAVLEVRARTGLLTWEALRQAPEGGAFAWITETDAERAGQYAHTLREQVGALPVAMRPQVLAGALSEAGAVLDAQAAGVKFDRVLGHDVLQGQLDGAAALAQALFDRVGPFGRVLLVETVPKHTQRLAELVPPKDLDPELHHRWLAAEEARYADPGNPRTGWDVAALVEIWAAAGWNVTVERVATRRRVQVTPALFERWWTAYGPAMADRLSADDLDTLRAWARPRWTRRTVDWRGAQAWLVAKRA